ncbi:hypothetical protein [Simkania sp.]|uniref:hypothetical protein n=1 Tax=Simkania sp. TaxID=34094 RepID=UPI003B518594
MTKLLITVAICCACFKSFCNTNKLSKFGNTEIKRLVVVGERCSGTNYVSKLLLRNFPTLVPTLEFGHKHFLWWFDSPYDKEKLSRVGYNSKHITLKDSGDCLFVFVIRNPYDWLRSFYQSPHHVHGDLLEQGFVHFINHLWKSQDIFRYQLLEDLNPFTNLPFKNILDLRNFKNRNYLKLGKLVKNFTVVRYETVAENPQKFIENVAAQYNLKSTTDFVPIFSYKGEGTKNFKKKKYRTLNHETLSYINNELDWELEHQLGYEKQKTKSWIYRLMKKIERKCRKLFFSNGET